MLIIVTLVVLALSPKVYTEEICPRVGRVCSGDCTKILSCTKAGRQPYFTRSCLTSYYKSYCSNSIYEAGCGAEIANCNDVDTVKITCSGLGHFPHPLVPSMSLICNEKDAPPEMMCYCIADFPFVDNTVRWVPCSKTAPIGLKQLVDCSQGTAGSGIFENEYFKYSCNSSDEITVAPTEKYKYAHSGWGFRTCYPYSWKSTNHTTTPQPNT